MNEIIIMFICFVAAKKSVEDDVNELTEVDQNTKKSLKYRATKTK